MHGTYPAQGEGDSCLTAASARSHRAGGDTARLADYPGSGRHRQHVVSGKNSDVFETHPAIRSGVGRDVAEPDWHADRGIGGGDAVRLYHQHDHGRGGLEWQVDFHPCIRHREAGLGRTAETAHGVFCGQLEAAGRHCGKGKTAIRSRGHGAHLIGGKGIIQPEGDFNIGHGSGASAIGDQPEDAAQGCFQHRNLTDFSGGAQRQTDRARAACCRIGHGKPVSAQRDIS